MLLKTVNTNQPLSSENEIAPFKKNGHSNQTREQTEKKTKPTKKQRTKTKTERREEQQTNNAQKDRASFLEASLHRFSQKGQ